MRTVRTIRALERSSGTRLRAVPSIAPAAKRPCPSGNVLLRERVLTSRLFRSFRATDRNNFGPRVTRTQFRACASPYTLQQRDESSPQVPHVVHAAKQACVAAVLRTGPARASLVRLERGLCMCVTVIVNVGVIPTPMAAWCRETQALASRSASFSRRRGPETLKTKRRGELCETAKGRAN